MAEKRIKVAFFVPSIKEKAGVYRYCFEFLKNLLQRGTETRFYCFYLPGNLLVQELRESISIANHKESCEFIEIGKLFNFREEISAADVDIVHFLAPDLRSLYLSFLTPRRFFTVITIYDLYCFKDRFSPTFRSLVHQARKYFLKFRARSFNKFIAVSGNTAKDIVTFMHVSAENILTVYPGISPKFFVSRSIGCPNEIGDYILSNRIWPPFFPILKDFLKTFPTYKAVVFASKNGMDWNAVLRIADELGVANSLIFKIDIPDEELMCLYRNAKLFIRYVEDEGFGFPVAEAMACGCPILASNRGSLPEVVGIPDLVIPPEDGGKWLEMMKKIAKDQDFRVSTIKREKEQVKNFNWNYSVDKVINLYRIFLDGLS